MAETRQHSGTVWERLRRNREQNTSLFMAAGVRPELAGDVTCPACGARESALFWSTVRRNGQTLRLLCPVCEEARVRFSLAQNRPVDPVLTRGSVCGGAGMIAVLAAVGALYFHRDAAPVHMVMEDLHSVRRVVVKRIDRAVGSASGSGSWSPPSSSGGSSGSARGPRSVSASSAGTASSGAAGRNRGTASAPTLRPEARRTEARRTEAADAWRETGDAGVLVFVSRGDRRGAVDAYAAQIIQRAGVRESSLLLGVEYDPEINQTRVVVDTTSVEWPSRLSWLRGWRRAKR